jgi:hypothetical protein
MEKLLNLTEESKGDEAISCNTEAVIRALAKKTAKQRRKKMDEKEQSRRRRGGIIVLEKHVDKARKSKFIRELKVLEIISEVVDSLILKK